MTKDGLFMKYFVLSPLKDDPYGKASRDALLEYAMSIAKTNPGLSEDLNQWLYSINMKLDKSKTENTLPEAAEEVQTPKDMPSHDPIPKTPKFNEPDGPGRTFASSDIYKNQIETCTGCKSRNIAFLSYEDGDLYPQWECYDCGEIFYDQEYGNHGCQTKKS